MTKLQFRILLVLSLVLGVVGGLLDIFFPALVPDALRTAQEAHDVALLDAQLFLVAGVTITGLSLVLTATYGCTDSVAGHRG